MSFSLFSQDFFWKAGIFSFFDNLEFAGSEVKKSQTMAGVMAAPEIGFRWDSLHRISGGVNLMHEFGSKDVIDRLYPVIYYEYGSDKFSFIMGAFPRSLALERYPRMFFQDSLAYYRPNINGIFLEYHPPAGYINAWLDWTGRQTETERESFFAGFSGEYHLRNFYSRNYSYMFHYASRKDPVVHEALHDNLLFHTSLGADFSGKTFLTRLDINAGWVLGLERERVGSGEWIAINGLQAELRAEYKFAGIFNTFYAGNGMMNFYGNHDNKLYWGDPVYRSRVYDRLDLYVKFLEKQGVDLELTWSFHFLEGKIYNEQMLKLKLSINGESAAVGASKAGRAGGSRQE